ncbi:MAG: Gfo/Idh/MocA family oxidoreductase [Candidatus Tectomicrobia bacterium]
MDNVKLAIVGCGTISQLNAPGYLQHQKCDVVALCDPLRERAEQRARAWGIAPTIYTEYAEVLHDASIDAVELLTPTYLHPEQIIAGLDAGKHVSCQKPIAATIAEVDDIARAVARAHTTFRITENFLYYPPIVKAKELLDSGIIGEPSMLRIRTIRATYANNAHLTVEPGALVWRNDPSLNAGGLMYDDGWHKYATAMWWLGDIEKVQGIVTKTDDTSEVPSVATWKFKDRPCLGVFDCASAAEMPIRTKYYPIDEFFEIQGAKGAIWVTRCTGEMLDMPPVILFRGTEAHHFQEPMDWSEGFNGAARDFIDSILEHRQPQMDIEFSKKVLQVALAVYEASRSERAVDPSLLT